MHHVANGRRKLIQRVLLHLGHGNVRFRIVLATAFAQDSLMLARVLSVAVNGIEAFPVEVEVNSGWGDTTAVIVGQPDAVVKASRNRVSAALTNFGFKFPWAALHSN